MTQTVVYLHGFPSSPASNKANVFRAPLEARGVRYLIPDLNVPDFEHCTLSAQLARIAETVRSTEPGPLFLVGSSLGGLAALHFYDRYRGAEAARIGRMALLAPAFDFAEGQRQSIGPDWAERWREAGMWPFFHPLYGREMPVHYGFAADILRYDSYAVRLEVPTLIYHGTHDDVVLPAQSERFAVLHQDYVDLRLIESDHQMLDHTAEILAGLVEFLGLQ